MKKLSIILALSLLIGMMPVQTFAAQAKPILKNSSFDSNISGWTGSNGGTVSYDKTQDCAGKSGGSMKGTVTSGSFLDFISPAEMTPGGKYELSFYAKADAENIRIQAIRIHGGGWSYLPTVTISTAWEKYTVSFINPVTNQQGTYVDSSGNINLRILDKATVWVDEVYIKDPSVEEEEETTVNPVYYEPFVYNGGNKTQTIIPFADTPGHWAHEMLSVLRTEGAVHGVGNDMYEPDRSITRAEFLTMLTEHLNIEDNKYKGMYPDVLSGEWYAPKVQNAYELGLISPVLTTDGNFRPEEEISREDACVMAASFAYYTNAEDKRGFEAFSDNGSESAYAAESVKAAYCKGIINGFEDNTFRPHATLTRAEAAQLLANIIEASGRMCIYVDGTNGNDTADGSMRAPLKSIKRAQTMARNSCADMKNNIYVMIKGGEYFMNEPLELTPADSGTNGYSVIYTSYGGTQAVLTGGKHLSADWVIDDPDKGIYKTYIGTDIQTRQMFVNGLRMTRARTDGGFDIEHAYSALNKTETGYTTGDKYFKNHRDISDMELVYYKDWTNPRCGVESLVDNGDGTFDMIMENPCWNYLMNKAHLKISNPRYFENQYEFVDTPGEWYIDRSGWLYYIPYDFIDLSTADVVLPVKESLMTVTGSKDGRVENVAFSDLGFKYATWLRPSTGYGYTDAQGGRIREGSDNVPDASVWVKYTKNVTFNECEFSKLGITALNVTDWVEDVKITGNHIYDISGCGMYVGNHGTQGGVSGDVYMSQNILIKNNLIHDYGIDYGSSDGIEGMTMSYAEVSHNEIYNARYSGLVLGYGAAGGRYAIDYVNNYIHDVLNENIYDGGCVYVTQPTGGTEERYNQIAYNYCSNQGNATGVLYADNNTTFWDIHHNVVNQTRTPYWYYDRREEGISAYWFFSNAKSNCKLHSNYTNTDNYRLSGRFATEDQPDTEVGENYVYPDADWPQEAHDIVTNAGLEQKYLEKYQTGIESVELTERKIDLAQGETIDLHEYIRAFGRKDVPMDPSGLRLVCSTDSPEAISISPDGKVTGVDCAKALLNIRIINGDVCYDKQLTVISADGFDSVEFNRENVQVYVGKGSVLSAKGVSKTGQKLEIDSISYSVADPSVAQIDENGRVTGLSAGKTVVTADVECAGERITKQIPVAVKDVSDNDGFNISDYIVADWKNVLSDVSLWSSDSKEDIIAAIPGGISVSTPGNAVGSRDMYGDELIKTKIKIEADGGWPSIAVRAADRNAAYGSNTEYMVTFNDGKLSLQRFNNGERRVFDDATVECDFKLKEEHKIYIGAINHDDSVEIIVCIDGFPVMRYHDYDDARITDDGYVQIYCRAGNFNLMAAD